MASTSNYAINPLLLFLSGEMLAYAEACQERCAKTLQTNLVRVHRRACRQLSARLRSALIESGASTATAGSGGSQHTANPMR